MTDKQTPEPLQPELLTLEQTCQLVNVARPTLYKLSATGALGPLPVKLCRKVLYSKSEIQAWIQAGCPHRKIWQTMKKDFRK